MRYCNNPNCNNSIDHKGPLAKYCSRVCTRVMEKARKGLMRAEVYCQNHCGKSFVPKSKNHKYCSEACGNAAYARENKESLRPKWREYADKYRRQKGIQRWRELYPEKSTEPSQQEPNGKCSTCPYQSPEKFCHHPQNSIRHVKSVALRVLGKCQILNPQKPRYRNP